MLKFLNYLATLCLVFSGGCTQKIDFEHDVPQRAKAISQLQAEAIRSSMEVPELRQKYRQHIQQQNQQKTLAQLQQEKREIELKIAHIVGVNNSNICPLCRKKFNITPSAKKTIVKKKQTRKKSPPLKTPRKGTPQATTGKPNNTSQRPMAYQTGIVNTNNPINTNNQQPSQPYPYAPYTPEPQLFNPQMPQQEFNNMPQQPMPMPPMPGMGY